LLTVVLWTSEQFGPLQTEEAMPDLRRTHRQPQKKVLFVRLSTLLAGSQESLEAYAERLLATSDKGGNYKRAKRLAVEIEAASTGEVLPPFALA
jgi:hypothetical protein